MPVRAKELSQHNFLVQCCVLITSPNNTTSGSINQETVDYKVILAVVIAIVVFALMATSTVVVYRRRKKSRRSERDEEHSTVIPKNSETQQSELSRDINEEKKLIDKPHTYVSPRVSQPRARQSAKTIEMKEHQNLIGDDMIMYEIPGNIQTQQSEQRREHIKQEELKDSTMAMKKDKTEYHILILLCVRNADEDTVKKEALEELNVDVDMKNSFQKWADNKAEKSYVFQDWIKSHEEYNEDALRKTQLEICQAIEKYRTKFVFVLPLKVWTDNEILKEMENWNSCKKKTLVPN